MARMDSITEPSNTSFDANDLLIFASVAEWGSFSRAAERRVLPGWCLPSHPAWAVFPERKLMPVKTRVFIDMLQTALARVQA